MWWMFACSVGSGGLETPIALKGDGVHVMVTSDRGCGATETRVELWADGYATQGRARADVVPDKDGSVWLNFAVDTGLGEAVAALRIEGNSGVIPLGVRPGEHEILLTKVPVDSIPLERVKEESDGALKAARRAWQDGYFLLKNGDSTVGELQFRGDRPPLIGVFDRWWLTPRPVEASLRADGAEMLVGFDVEPSLKGEGGMLRISVPLGRAVAPIGDIPVSEERTFELVPGSLSEAERSQLVEAAIKSADAIESELVQQQARRLAEHAVGDDGTCLDWDEMVPSWGLIFMGYDVEITQVEPGCEVVIEPTHVQHGRRYRGRVNR